jgi:hypothetical protein
MADESTRTRDENAFALCHLFTLNQLPNEVKEKPGVVIEVPAPEAPRLAAKPEQPLETRDLHPRGRLRLATRVEVESRTHAHHDTRKRIPMISDPALLFGAAEADEEDVRFGGFDAFDQFLILISAGEAKWRGEGEGNI